MPNEFLASNLRFLRNDEGLTLKELAERLNLLNYQTYDGWEKGKTKPGIDTVSDICNYYGLTMDILLNTDLSKIDKKDLDFLLENVNLPLPKIAEELQENLSELKKMIDEKPVRAFLIIAKGYSINAAFARHDRQVFEENNIRKIVKEEIVKHNEPMENTVKNRKRK